MERKHENPQNLVHSLPLTFRNAFSEEELRRLVGVVVAVVLHEIVRLSGEARLDLTVEVLEQVLCKLTGDRKGRD